MDWYKKSYKLRCDSDLDVDYSENGKDYIKSIVDDIVKNVWNRNDLEDIKDSVKDKTSDSPNKVMKYPVGMVNEMNVFLVNGNEVKIKFFMDFVEGGNDMVYGRKHEKNMPSYMPDNEIWIDADLDINSFPYVLLHESVERQLMKTENMEYEKAHPKANGVEKTYRKQMFFEKLRK